MQSDSFVGRANGRRPQRRRLGRTPGRRARRIRHLLPDLLRPARARVRAASLHPRRRKLGGRGRADLRHAARRLLRRSLRLLRLDAQVETAQPSPAPAVVATDKHRRRPTRKARTRRRVRKSRAATE